MRGRRSPTTAHRYAETRFFGKRLGELLDHSPLSQTTAAEQMGILRENVSGYRNGRGLPEGNRLEETVERIVETLVPRKKDQRELRDLAHADLLAAWMLATGRSVKDVERYLGIVGR